MTTHEQSGFTQHLSHRFTYDNSYRSQVRQHLLQTGNGYNMLENCFTFILVAALKKKQPIDIMLLVG